MPTVERTFRIADIIQIVVIVVGFLYMAGARNTRADNLVVQQKDLAVEVGLLKKEVIDLRVEMAELRTVLKYLAGKK